MFHPIDQQVGATLRRYREIAGLSQTELGKRLGVSFQQVQKYEVGTNRLSASRLWLACDILGIAPNDMFEGAGRRSTAAGPLRAHSGRQVLDLNTAFGHIPDPHVRRNLVQLCKSLQVDRADVSN
jgi:transcriptional regulator with XRE-family HTH domain